MPGAKPSRGLQIALVACLVQVITSLTLKAGWAATFFSDALPLIITAVLIVTCSRNARLTAGSTRMFWYLNTAAFVTLLLSHVFWLYWEVLREIGRAHV